METPNVLLVVLDSARADHTSVHGYERPTTPNLELLAEDASRFDNAFAAAPWTPPSHGSLFAGVHPTSHGFLDTGMSYRPPHAPLAERFRREGYRTFGAVQNSNITSETQVTYGFDEYCDLYRLPFVPDSLGEFKEYYLDLLPGYFRMARDLIDADRKPGEHLTCEYVRHRIRGAHGHDPFFGFINILSPHSTYAPPEPHRSRFERPDDPDVDDELVEELSHHGGYRYMAGELSPTDQEWTAVQDRYDAEIAFADHMLGTILDTLREEDLYDETTIVVTADHGEHFGEHGRAYHQFSLYDELLHVPLLIKPPGGSGNGRAIDDLVSLVDIYPTVLSSAGLSVPETVEGFDVFADHSREIVYAEYGDPETAISSLENHAERPVDMDRLQELDHALQCARTTETKYVRVHGGEDRIYDVGSGGPKDTLRRTGRHDELAASLSAHLGGDLGVETTEPTDPKIRKNLEALGYR